MSKPIVVVGSINIDLVNRVGRLPRKGQTLTGSGFAIHPGGKGANQAVAVARLGAPVRLIGRLGDDAFAPMLRAALENDGVNIDAVRAEPGPSGVAVVLVDDDGENSIIVNPGANARLTPRDLDAQIETIRSAACVLTQLEIPLATVEHLARICSRESVPLILDPSPEIALPTTVLAATTWFTPNQTEAAFYGKRDAGRPAEQGDAELATELLRRGPAGVVLKQGERGVFLALQNGDSACVAAHAVTALDSTAAGDTFNGAFAVGLSRGMQPAQAARFANAAAALSVTRAGAQPSMPTLDEVEQLLSS